MKILGDGRIFLEKGEQFPMVCPKCTRYIEFTDAPVVKCPHCKYTGPHDKFVSGFSLESGAS